MLGRFGTTNLVNVTQHGLLNTIVLDDLSQDTSITTTDNENLLWLWVRVHGQVSDHLLVGKLVALGGLDDVVKHEYHAVVAGLEDEDILVLGLLVVHNLVDFQCHGLTGPHWADLAEPAILDRGVCDFGHSVCE